MVQFLCLLVLRNMVHMNKVLHPVLFVIYVLAVRMHVVLHPVLLFLFSQWDCVWFFILCHIPVVLSVFLFSLWECTWFLTLCCCSCPYSGHACGSSSFAIVLVLAVGMHVVLHPVLFLLPAAGVVLLLVGGPQRLQRV